MLTQIDIEELVQHCRSNNARSYIREAVDCYRIGAYRACIITTWIALVYDLVDKLRELAVAGDKAALLRVQEFDKIQNDEDLEGALRFEREVIDVAKGQFELISPQEALDLRRLFQDRNRCGHPNLSRETESYSPPPELARLHLRNAIEHVLSRPPTQGKAALAKIWTVVKSGSFPTKVSDSKKILKGTPIAYAKKNLISEFFAGALTALMRENLTEQQRLQYLAACISTEQLHPSETQQILEQKFDNFITGSDDDALPRIILLLAAHTDYLSYIKEPSVIRLRTFINKIPSTQTVLLPQALKVTSLTEAASERLRNCSEPELYAIVSKLESRPPDWFIEKCIALYSAAKNRQHVGTLATAIIIPLVNYASKAQAELIVKAVKNPEIKKSKQYPIILSAIGQVGALSKDEAKQILKSSGHEDACALLG